ncbi:MAG: response regulator [Bacteroidia bacterium]|nr:response regulator [Bacteroidia bacterium]
MDTRKITVLVVDDDFFNVQVLQAILENAGYNIIPVYGGYEAMEKITSSNIDLILLDLVMPGIDGYQVLDFIKENPEKAHIPVICVSALSEFEHITKAMNKGAADYITKPFINSVLLEKVQKLIPDKE